MKLAELHGCGNDELALGSDELSGGLALYLVDLVEDSPRCRQIGRSDIRQGKLPGRANKKLRAQEGLEVRDLAGNRRDGNPQLPSGRREATAFDHRGQDRHGLQSVHSLSRFLEK